MHLKMSSGFSMIMQVDYNENENDVSLKKIDNGNMSSDFSMIMHTTNTSRLLQSRTVA